MAPRLMVSVVTYRTPPATLTATLDSLARATGMARQRQWLGNASLVVVENGPGGDTGPLLWELLRRPAYQIFCQRILFSNQGNVGYGIGHNRGLAGSVSDYHLVLNPDVLLAPDALVEALQFMEAHPDAGLLAPRVEDQHGCRQYLCKRYPSVVTLLLRAFAPAWLRGRFEKRLHRYEMRDLLDADNVVWDFPIASGCFMVLRTPVVRRVGGFSPRFFLYFEDFDLSLRVGRVSRTVYVPAVRITHLGGGAARKGWRHIVWFGHSMVRFFNRHGWCWC